MEVVQVKNKKQIKAFVNFPTQLYKGDDNYVPYMLADLTKTLRHLLLEKKTYTALLVVENKKPLARVLFTI